jgi:hypothetical protein
MADKNYGIAAPDRYHPIDKEHAADIARAYDEMKHAPNDPKVAQPPTPAPLSPALSAALWPF